VSDDDWAQSVELRVACIDEGLDPAGYRIFAERRGATMRALVALGHGGWFGAFVDGRLVSQMGLIKAGSQLARFQSVETDPGFRRQGLAGSLVHHVSRVGFDEFGASTLVMVADPDYFAIDLYRAVGFEVTEAQLQVERRPTG
jgi:predicted GNAT family acetyltransferase